MSFPLIRQYDSMQCGIACLSMIYKFHSLNISMYRLANPNINLCDFNRRYMEAILFLIYQLRSDKEVWKLFLSKCRRKYS